MRLPRPVARAALIVALALVAAPGTVGSRVPSSDVSMGPAQFREVGVPPAGALTTTLFDQDETKVSDGHLDGQDPLVEPPHGVDPLAGAPPAVQLPVPSPISQLRWRHSEASFYGPGFYGKRTACGLALTTTLKGVAHRTLPCGTLVTFRNPANGRVITVPVVDRGPYVTGRVWDLTGGTCVALDFCYTGTIYWHLGGQ